VAGQKKKVAEETELSWLPANICTALSTRPPSFWPGPLPFGRHFESFNQTKAVATGGLSSSRLSGCNYVE